jgi:transcriptional regulator with XRE-family HTH domain
MSPAVAEGMAATWNSSRPRLGANIARWRRLRGLTQRELARRRGCDHSAVSLWEAGKRLPSLVHLVALRRVLGCGAQPLLPAEESSSSRGTELCSRQSPDR